jgi:hypothetical protein
MCWTTQTFTQAHAEGRDGLGNQTRVWVTPFVMKSPVAEGERSGRNLPVSASWIKAPRLSCRLFKRRLAGRPPSELLRPLSPCCVSLTMPSGSRAIPSRPPAGSVEELRHDAMMFFTNLAAVRQGRRAISPADLPPANLTTVRLARRAVPPAASSSAIRLPPTRSETPEPLPSSDDDFVPEEDGMRKRKRAGPPKSKKKEAAPTRRRAPKSKPYQPAVDAVLQLLAGGNRMFMAVTYTEVSFSFFFHSHHLELTDLPSSPAKDALKTTGRALQARFATAVATGRHASPAAP